jgi:hypothetical protein
MVFNTYQTRTQKSDAKWIDEGQRLGAAAKPGMDNGTTLQ